MADEGFEFAVELYEKARKLCQQGEPELAMDLCRRSLELCATAEARTLPGWIYHDQGRVDDAIAECKKATRSRRYRGHHFPWYNLGRVYAAKELFNRATECFEHALEIEPDYTEAETALRRLKLLVQ